MHLQIKLTADAGSIIGSILRYKPFMRLICLLSLFVCVGAPDLATAEESTSGLRPQIERLFSEQLVPNLPRGATVTVQATFPYINPSDPARSGLPSQLSGLLLAETRAAFADLKIDLATASRTSEQVRQNGFDPCVEADLSRYVVAGQYQLMGDRIKLQYRICNQENASERWPQLDIPLSLFPGIEVKPVARAGLETWIGGAEAGQAGIAPRQPAPQTVPPSETSSSRPAYSTSARTAEEGSSLKVTVAADRGPNALYYLHETIRYDIRANQNCHVYVWNVTAVDNKMTLLFPNHFQPDNFVKGGSVLTIGNAQDLAGSWLIAPPTGRETLMVWAIPTTQQFADYDEKQRFLATNLFWEEPIPTESDYQVVKRKSVTMLSHNIQSGSEATVVVAPIRLPPPGADERPASNPTVPTTVQVGSLKRPDEPSSGHGCDAPSGVFCYKTTYTSMSPIALVPTRSTP